MPSKTNIIILIKCEIIVPSTFNDYTYLDIINLITFIHVENSMETIKKVDERFRGFLESLPDAIVIVNSDGIIQIVNSQTEQLFGYSKDEIIGHAVEKLMTSHHRNMHHAHRKNFWDNPKARPMGAQGRDLFAQRKDGNRFPVAISLNKLEIEEGIFILAAIRDVSYQKKIEKELTEAKTLAELATEIAIVAQEKAESAMKAKQQFLSNMSHEIRTPMTAIIGFSKVVLKTELTDKQKEYISAIKTSSDSLLVLINDILDLAKVDAGKMSFEQTAFNMESDISAMLNLFDLKFKEKNIELVRKYDNKIPKVLLGDSVRLNQIILNLVSNALKFTTIGKIIVNVQMLNEDEEKVTIEFAVSDTGIGLEENMISTIFENFQQATSSTARLFGGTGLGLAIVKQLVERQGGTINVKSKINEGSTFSFILSFQKTKAEIELESEIVKLDTKTKKINVLVVEDVALNQLLMKIILDDFGFDRDIANNGKEALEKLKTNSYDIILMDLQMPEMNGFETTQHIRNKLSSKIPIIALTADVTAADLAQCKSIGMDDHIAKPIDEKMLYIKIVELVKLAR
jgi:PAS domain S-box-containing protein